MRLAITLLIILGLFVAGCSKDESDIEALEKEASQDKAQAVMDSLSGNKAADTVPQVESAATEEASPAKTTPVYQEDERATQGGFVIQVASYSTYQMALANAEKYKTRGYPAFVKQVSLDGNTYYRLRIGVYDTKAEAKNVAATLVDRFSAQYWIDWNN